MANYTTLSALFTDVANAIRAKTGGSENIVADNFPTEILAIPSGSSTINGKLFDCGSFTLTSAVTSAYTISHSLGSTPSAAFLWVTNPSYATRGIVGKYRADTSSESNSASLTAVNGAFSTGAGTTGSRFRLGWSDTDLTVNCDSTYPLLAGLTYQWLVIEP
jgi:hypothetical protein